jgi:hypothetical protein
MSAACPECATASPFLYAWATFDLVALYCAPCRATYWFAPDGLRYARVRINEALGAARAAALRTLPPH